MCKSTHFLDEKRKCQEITATVDANCEVHEAQFGVKDEGTTPGVPVSLLDSMTVPPQPLPPKCLLCKPEFFMSFKFECKAVPTSIACEI